MWQWQLSGEVDTSVSAEMWDVDMFETPAATVADLQADGDLVVCYVSAGSWERWRPDAGDFPASVKGKPLDGWPGERWLDVRALDVLGPLMQARIDHCAAKGFDGIEFDNVDGYTNNSGFPLTADDQLAYNAWLANAAHEAGLSAALKNDPDQVATLVDYFDWALVEECFRFRECRRYSPFVEAGKPVFEVEYELARSEFCAKAQRLRFDAMRKKLKLNAWRRRCQ